MAHQRADGWYWLYDTDRYGWEAVHVQDDRVSRIGLAGSKKICEMPDDMIWRGMSYETKIRPLRERP